MKKKIKIKLVDGFEDVIGKEHEFFKALEERYDIEFSETPDYLLCSCFSGEFLKYDCIKIVVMAENITPDFNLYDYAIGFDHMEYGDRYLRLPNYVYYCDAFKSAGKKHFRDDKYFLEKKKFCNFIYSNNKACDKIRNEFFLRLSQYKKVDAGGKVYNNIGYRVKNKRKFQEEYKFSIAFENSRKEGYTTEKIIQAWAAGTIPIYWGNTDIGKEFNPKAFINLQSFESEEECIKFIKKVDQDEQLYLNIQKQPIFENGSLAERYYENPEMFIDFLSSIFDKPIEEAKKIYNVSCGYNKWYMKVINKGWRTRTICNTIYHKIKK